VHRQAAFFGGTAAVPVNHLPSPDHQRPSIAQPRREGDHVMSKIVAALAIATVIASPAFAQSFDPSVGSGNIARSPYRNSPSVTTSDAHRAYAQNPVESASATAPGRERKAK
jgi:hypothetical protein